GAGSFSAAANPITLTSANALTGAVTLSDSGANDVALTNTLATVLAASTVGRNLVLTAGGSVSETGALTVGGTTTVSLTAASSDVLLDTQANALTGAFGIGGTLANLRDFALRNTLAGAAVPSLAGLANLRDLSLRFDSAAIVLPA